MSALRRLAMWLGLVTVASFGVSWLMAGVAAGTVGTSDVDGADLYAIQCSSCHGPDGAGIDGRGPSLQAEGEAAVDFVLRTGRMPLADPNQEARRGPIRFSEAEIVALVSFAGGFGEGPGIPAVDVGAGDVTSGGDLYRLNCAACHVASGSGAIIGGGRRAPSLVEASPTEVVEAIVVGPGAMPVFGELTPAQAIDIATYVDDLQQRGATNTEALGGIGPVAEGLAAWLLALVPLIAMTRWIGETRSESPQSSDRELTS